VAVEAAQPDQGHAVGHNQVRCIQNFLEERIMLRFHDTVHARRCDGMTCAALANPSLHPFKDSCDLRRVRPNSEYSKVSRIF
jgi:hypothetical protein